MVKSQSFPLFHFQCVSYNITVPVPTTIQYPAYLGCFNPMISLHMNANDSFHLLDLAKLTLKLR